MATEIQITDKVQGGGRPYRVHLASLAITAGVVGVTGSGTITGGSGYTNGVYPLVATGGALATGGSLVQGTFTVAGGAVSAISITAPGQYTTAPTAFSFAAAGPGSGASATPTTAQCAVVAYPVANDRQSLPPGARITVFRAFTAAALAGSPTNGYVSIGATAFGQDYVAQTDAKAQGEITLTKVGSGLAAIRGAGVQTGQVFYVALVINGGASAVSGMVEVEIHYVAPN